MEAAPGDLPLDVSQIQSRSQTFATGRRWAIRAGGPRGSLLPRDPAKL